MDASQVYRHENYELRCSAKALDTGKYLPLLVVCKQVWPTRPREIAVQRGDYVDADTAIQAAYQQGVAWIRDYG
jgi:hypothetical protein